MSDDRSERAHRIESREDVTAESPYTLPGFFDALADGAFLGGVCDDCGTVLIPPRPACYECGSRDVRIETQPRTGRIVSYTEVRVPARALADEAPFSVAVVELDSGGRITGRVDAPYDALAIDDRVRLTVHDATAADPEPTLSYEADWPVHVFELE